MFAILIAAEVIHFTLTKSNLVFVQTSYNINIYFIIRRYIVDIHSICVEWINVLKSYTVTQKTLHEVPRVFRFTDTESSMAVAGELLFNGY